ncbi:MAG: TPR end-of-group domain-containing protein, partial [Anaerolineales bacterium]
LDPKDAYPHNGIGSVYQLMGEHEKALRAYQKAVELAPERGMYRVSLVGILRKLGREEEAQAQIEIARPLMAKESEYNRACFESICGNVEEALRLLQIALEKKQVSLEWARRDPDFDNLRQDARFRALVGLE